MTGTEGGTSTRLGFVAAVAQAFEDAGVRSRVPARRPDTSRRATPTSTWPSRARASSPSTRSRRAGRTGSATAALRLRRALVPLLRDRDGRSRPPLPPARHRLRSVRNRALRRRGSAGARAGTARGRSEHALSGRDGCLPRGQASSQGHRGQADIRQLQQDFNADPAGASTLLQAAFGDCGIALARALGDGSDPVPALRDIGRLIEARRRAPRRLALRARFGTARVIRRLGRPTGLLVSVVGPDGTGKTTLADGLESAADGLFEGTRRLHLPPACFLLPGRLLGRRGTGDTSQPHARPPVGTRRIDRPDRLPRSGHIDRLASDGQPGEEHAPPLSSSSEAGTTSP